MQTFTIPGRLPGYNQLGAGSGEHWAVKKKRKDAAMERVWVACLAAGVRKPGGQPSIAIRCYEPDLRRDEDNVETGAKKIILDALQRNGILKNDNRKGLKKCRCEVLLDRKNPRVEVDITETEDEK